MSLAEFHFIRPYWLLTLIPAVAIVVLMLRSKLSQGLWSSVCDAALLPYLLQEKTVKSNRWILATGALSSLLAIIALAGPTWQRLPSPAFRNASALVIALDLSRSMDAEDIKPSRLIRARYKIADILKQRKDGQTALLVYAGDAFTVTPLTDDTETIDSQLPALTTSIMPSPGSNTALVLNKAAELFKQAGLQKGQIILVTDGVDADRARTAVTGLDNFQLSILGVGTVEGAPIPLSSGGFMKDEHGTIIIPKLNEADLRKLAQAGHGVYQTITDNDADIQALLASADKPGQQKNASENLLLEQWDDKGPWLLLLVLLLAALMFRKGVLCFALLLILPLPRTSHAFEWQDLWRTQDQRAQQAYENGQFEQAAALFENPDWKAAANYKAGAYDKALENPRLETSDNFYNQGNALAQSGKLEESIKAYEKALAINPNNVDAKYNKELVEKELEKQKKQQTQKDQQKNDQSRSQEKPRQDQNKEQENKQSEQSANGQRPEQKPERPDKEEKQQADQQETADKQDQQAKAEEKKSAAEQTQQKEQNNDEGKEQEKAGTEDTLSTEQQQANEQWLKRIPDDPSGLLKRKFKYQYGRRSHQDAGEAW